MKYIFLAGSILLFATGISQAMDAFKTNGLGLAAAVPIKFDFQFITVSFAPMPGFVKIIILGAGLFCLYLIWKKLKALGLGHISDYVLE